MDGGGLKLALDQRKLWQLLADGAREDIDLLKRKQQELQEEQAKIVSETCTLLQSLSLPSAPIVSPPPPPPATADKGVGVNMDEFVYLSVRQLGGAPSKRLKLRLGTPFHNVVRDMSPGVELVWGDRLLDPSKTPADYGMTDSSPTSPICLRAVTAVMSLPSPAGMSLPPPAGMSLPPPHEPQTSAAVSPARPPLSPRPPIPTPPLPTSGPPPSTPPETTAKPRVMVYFQIERHDAPDALVKVKLPDDQPLFNIFRTSGMRDYAAKAPSLEMLWGSRPLDTTLTPSHYGMPSDIDQPVLLRFRPRRAGVSGSPMESDSYHLRTTSSPSLSPRWTPNDDADFWRGRSAHNNPLPPNLASSLGSSAARLLASR